jgi:hypothetical protein
VARSPRDAGGDAERVDHQPDAVQTEDALQVDFDITVVGGEHGRQLAALQAETVLDVLTWLHEHYRTGITTE